MKWALIVFGVLANAAASTLVKSGSGASLSLSLESVLANWRLILALGFYGVAFLLYAAAVARLPLNVAHPITTAGAIVLVGLVSAFVFHEDFSVWRMVGYGVLLSGIVILALAPEARA